MRLNVETTIENTRVEAIVAEIAAGTMTKGAGIRECFAGGLEVKDIAAKLGIRYNHVYNVVKNEVLIHDLEVEKSARGGENSKKAQIVQMLQDGKTITEVSRELKCMYNYVWSVAKSAGLTKKQEEINIIVPDDLVPMAEESKKGKKKVAANA
jgi:hypothetical protein